MQYSKAMIDLMKEARRRAPTDQKAAIKLANPDVLAVLLDIYQLSRDAVFRAIVKELVELAGEPWYSRLKTPEKKVEGGGYIVKSYRGVTQLLDRPEPEVSAAKREHSRKRVYRGQVVPC